jgi:hypothetical protein
MGSDEESVKNRSRRLGKLTGDQRRLEAVDESALAVMEQVMSLSETSDHIRCRAYAAWQRSSSPVEPRPARPVTQ